MARETQKEKIARLETELAQAITQRDCISFKQQT